LAVRFGGISDKEIVYKILLFDGAYIELIELFPCDSKMALNLKEGEIIRTRDCVNKVIPGRTRAVYREDNKESIKQYRQTHKEEKKQYLQTHKESISAYRKQYQQTHKKMRKCSCGVEFNDGKTDHRNRHYESNHHIEFVNDFYERLHKLLIPE
jgi:hypothetical protein